MDRDRERDDVCEREGEGETETVEPKTWKNFADVYIIERWNTKALLLSLPSATFPWMVTAASYSSV